MSRPPHAREGVLDAFETLLREGGARAATMEATARAAGVSKGGLLYHFASKETLEAALIDRLEQLAREDLDQILAAPAGAIDAFIRTSTDTGTPLDRAIVAVSRLAQNGHPPANDALRRVREQWEEAMRPYAVDETALHVIMLVSDGLYFNSSLQDATTPSALPRGTQLDALIALLQRIARP